MRRHCCLAECIALIARRVIDLLNTANPVYLVHALSALDLRDPLLCLVVACKEKMKLSQT